MPLILNASIERAASNSDSVGPVMRVARVLWRASKPCKRPGFSRLTRGLSIGQIAAAAGCDRRLTQWCVRVLRVAGVFFVYQPPIWLESEGRASGFACNVYFWR